MIIIDNAGYQFIDGANESELFRGAGIEIKFFDFNTEKLGLEYELELKKVKREYNLKNHVICFKQVFSSDFIRNGNEYLQSCIDHKRIFFASRTAACGSFFSKSSSIRVPLKLTQYSDMGELIESQDDLIYQTKRQCALVEVKTTPKGTQTFDLPQNLRRQTGPNKPRKDGYSALLFGNWGIKIFLDSVNVSVQKQEAFFMPMIV